jgi:hypothetical protein
MPGILKDDDEPSDSMPANLLVALCRLRLGARYVTR